MKNLKYARAFATYPINLMLSLALKVTRVLALVLMLLMFLSIGFKASSYAQERPLLSSERQQDGSGRIISLAPHITELLFSVGAGDEIVGTVSFSDYPIEANEIPRIGSHNKLNYEGILTLRPTLVIGWDSGNGRESLSRLEQLGLRVYSFESHSLEDVATSLIVLGELTGNVKRGNWQASQFRHRLNMLKTLYSEVKPVSVYYQLWNEPQMTVNDEHLISDVIHFCGGRNIFSDAVPLIPKVGIESIVRRAPEVIIASGTSMEPPEWLDDWRNWVDIPAVKYNHLYHVHSDLLHRHSSRILEGAEQVCKILSAARQLSVEN